MSIVGISLTAMVVLGDNVVVITDGVVTDMMPLSLIKFADIVSMNNRRKAEGKEQYKIAQEIQNNV